MDLNNFLGVDNYIFDIGNVLINFDLEKLQKRISDNSDITYKELHETWNSPLFFKSETGNATSEEYYDELSKRISLKWSYKQFISEWSEVYSYNEKGNKLLDECNKKGNVYILSNLAELNKIAIEEKFNGFFDRTLYNCFSYDTGFRKPNLEIFEFLCHKINAEPAKCLFFDDLKENIDAAKKVGLQGIVFE